jgi:hypothetical protein
LLLESLLEMLVELKSQLLSVSEVVAVVVIFFDYEANRLRHRISHPFGDGTWIGTSRVM